MGGADLGFDPECPISFDDRARIRTWNALHTLNLTHCDAAVSPTHWQKSRHPEILRTPSGVVLKAGDPVVTYVARNLELYRGFHVFMRALEKIQRAHPTCHALIVGGAEVSYGRRPKDAKHWRERMLREVRLDASRTHFLGKVPYAEYLKVPRVSAAHVYLTYPFVLSWSLLEAMACGAPIVASDTAPVLEVVPDCANGLLVLFHDLSAIADVLRRELADGSGAGHRRLAAMRERVGRFSISAGLGGYTRLVCYQRAFVPATHAASGMHEEILLKQLKAPARCA